MITNYPFKKLLEINIIHSLIHILMHIPISLLSSWSAVSESIGCSAERSNRRNIPEINKTLCVIIR